MEYRSLIVHVHPDNEETLAAASAYVPHARAMIGHAQAMGDLSMFTGMQRELWNGVVINVRSFRTNPAEVGPESDGILFVAHISIPPSALSNPISNLSDSHFAYLWVGRRTISGGANGGECGGSNATTYLMVWEPLLDEPDQTGSRGGQIGGAANNVFAFAENRGESELIDRKLNWDGYPLNEEEGSEETCAYTDHGLVWRSAAYYQSLEEPLKGVPDREEDGEYWDEEVYLDPADGLDLNPNPILRHSPEFDSIKDAQLRALGAFPVNKYGKFHEGKPISGEYLIRILRIGDPCDEIPETEDEIKVVAGRFDKQTIDKYRIITRGHHNHDRFITPFGMNIGNMRNGLQWVPPGDCYNYNEQFSDSVISASPWGGSALKTDGVTPGVGYGGFNWICEQPPVYSVGMTTGWLYSIYEGYAAHICGDICMALWTRWTGYYETFDDLNDYWNAPGVETAYWGIIPTDCNGEFKYWPPDFATSYCAAPNLAIKKDASTLTVAGYPTCGTKQLIYDTGWYCRLHGLFSGFCADCDSGCITASDEEMVAAAGGYTEYGFLPRANGGLGGDPHPLTTVRGLWQPVSNETLWVAFEPSDRLDEALPMVRSMGGWTFYSVGILLRTWDDKNGDWSTSSNPPASWER